MGGVESGIEKERGGRLRRSVGRSGRRSGKDGRHEWEEEWEGG